MEYDLQCPDLCSLKNGTKWGETATAMLADGASLRTIINAAAKDGVTLNLATLSRHKKHLKPITPEVDLSAPRATNIEILEAIIQKGFANQKNWKPTITDTMKAMDMWFRLTQGNPFDELLDALAAAGTEGENPAAAALPDETGSEDA
jgi:hypothetical protein